jgi:hypothetical protein
MDILGEANNKIINCRYSRRKERFQLLAASISKIFRMSGILRPSPTKDGLF